MYSSAKWRASHMTGLEKAESGLCEISIVLGFQSHRMLFINRQPRVGGADQMGIFTPLQLYTAFCIYHFDTNLLEPICDVSTLFSSAFSKISNI